jgi:hypothetical protein
MLGGAVNSRACLAERALLWHRPWRTFIVKPMIVLTILFRTCH